MKSLRFRIFIFTCFIGLLIFQKATSQTPNFFQIVNVSNYQGDEFTFTFWFHAKFMTDKSFLLPMGLTFNQEKRLNLFKGNVSNSNSKGWNKLTVSGTIGKQAESLGVGVAYIGAGKYYFDNFKLLIKTKKTEITFPLENYSFESSNKNPWKFLYTPKNATISLSRKLSYSGKQSLCIDASGGETHTNDNSKITDLKSSSNSTTAKAKKLLVDSIIYIFQTQSIYKDKVNWDSLKPQLYKSIDYSKTNTVRGVIPAYIKLSKILNITHGGLNYKGKGYGAWNQNLSTMFNRISKTISQAAKNEKYIFRTKNIDGKYGYISIPHVGLQYSNDMNVVKRELKKKASIIQDSLCKLSVGGLQGIIIDLRLNNGGSTVAMMAGLTSLFKQGLLYSNVMANGNREKVVKSGKYLLFDKDTLVNLESQCPSLNKIKVAVLISPYTASAAEQTAILLAGRTKTTVIGEKTRGETSGIKTISLANGLTLDVATGYSSNGKGKIYIDGISPDIKVVGGDDFANLSKDKKVEAAIKWFKSQD